MQRDGEGGSTAQLALNLYFASVKLHQTSRDREAQSRSAELAADAAVGLRELIENIEQLVRRNARSAILHRDLKQELAGVNERSAHPYVHRSMLGKLHRIADQVGDDLADAQRIAGNLPRQIGRDLSAQRNRILAGFRLMSLDAIRQQYAQIERYLFQCHLSCFDLREIQNIVQQRQQRIGATLRRLQLFRQIRAQFADPARCPASR